MYRKDEYLEKGGGFCPFCGSEEITILELPDKPVRKMSRKVECYDCGEIWIDEFKLVGLEKAN
jgi:uncharacterized Zn finger protein